ncbi:MAG: hypothetical protein ACYDH6_05835 [Acidimicrobiales bacterium]
MTMLHLAQSLGLLIGACLGVALLLGVLVSALALLEPATLRLTHPPTRRWPRRE